MRVGKIIIIIIIYYYYYYLLHCRLTVECYVQDDLVQFYQLQMSVHHPQDAVDESSGAFAVDWNMWKVSLLYIFFTYTKKSFRVK